MTLDELRDHIGAVVDYNWSKEYADAVENGPTGHIIEHLVALSEFLGVPLLDDQREALYGASDDDGTGSR